MGQTLIKSSGELVFRQTSVVVNIDDNIKEYYYSLIPKYYYAQRQMYKAHISVVRGRYQTYPACMRSIGRVVDFEYENVVRFDGTYFFLQVFSDEIGKIRQSFGLTYYPWIFTSFHITVGNIKEVNSGNTKKEKDSSN
jgi:hypothetical protein